MLIDDRLLCCTQDDKPSPDDKKDTEADDQMPEYDEETKLLIAG